MVVFDDVFVPMERVFLAGEWQFAGGLVYMFGNYHRLSADAYKYIQLEIMVGLAALVAEYNGLENVSHVREKLAWLAMYAEGTDALGKAAAQNCEIDPESGLAYPNIIYSNVAKFFFADNYHQAEKHLQDITGGIAATMPSLADLENPETRPMIEKYLGGKAGIPTEDRLRAIRYVQELTTPHHAVTTIHAEGSLAAQRLTIWATHDWDRCKAAAKRAAGIKTAHPAFAQLPPFPMVKL
jgi:4-hydroxybutyryl-CoA dehydratase/vinylacetyl-CoA-Delta-isomerase